MSQLEELKEALGELDEAQLEEVAGLIAELVGGEEEEDEDEDDDDEENDVEIDEDGEDEGEDEEDD